MNRKDFIRTCGILGIALPFQSVLSSCGSDDDPAPNFTGDVLIIGAGAGGMAAGHLLAQQGINFQILEASSVYGGRMKRNNTFADFPIPMGAEWLHVERGIFDEIVNDSSVQIDVQTTPYNPDVDFGLLNGQRISVEESGFTIDQKFINSTWFDFFETYVVPSVRSNIRFNEVVQSIDYSGDRVTVQTQGNQYTADKVIVSVPVKILQNGAINFTPALPSGKQEAIDNVRVWDGFKAFIEFSEKFYPTFTAFDIQPESAGQKLYYDAAYGQNTSKHVLGLFTVGVATDDYRPLSDTALRDFMLNELDALYDGQASANYVGHISQNWNNEPHIDGGYIYDDENWRRVRTLGEPVGSNLFFAGDAYTDGEDWSSVHTAARSAKVAVDALVRS